MAFNRVSLADLRGEDFGGACKPPAPPGLGIQLFPLMFPPFSALKLFPPMLPGSRSSSVDLVSAGYKSLRVWRNAC
ncbi:MULTISPECIES: hypothetical protein [unclassified Microcoleus]|uniref:hypothetical protein n=1 Tax=unclassified Microcoleus TaxID=2642155 RepID=UPI002FD3473E